MNPKHLISIEVITLDQTLIEVITQTITEITHLQTFEIETITMTGQEVLQTTAIETIQIIVVGITLLIDHKTILTIDHIIKFIITDPVITLEIETTTIKTEQEIFLSHRVEITHNISTNKIKTTEVVHQKIKDKSTITIYK